MNNCYHYRICRGQDNYLHIQVRNPVQSIPNPYTIIFVHGFLGDGLENHRMFVRIAERLNELGYVCILFDQYGCGYSDGDYQSVRLYDAQADLETVTEWVLNNIGGKVGYISQSLGSSLSLSRPSDGHTAFKVAINPAASFYKWLTERYGWDLNSSEDLFCAFPKGIYVSRNYVLDLLNWNWIQEIEESIIPILIVASTKDDIGSADSAIIAKQKLGNLAEIQLIDGGNHSFIGQRPIEEKVTNVIQKWIKDISK